MTPPDPTALLDAPLRAAGFTRTDGPQGPGFGDRVVTWTRGRVVVRCVRDRGQWSVEAGREDWEETFDGDVWDGLLDGAAPAVRPRAPLEQAAALLDRLDRVAALAAGGAAREDLRQIRAERARRWRESVSR